MKRNLKTIFTVLILTLIDQAIKVYISSNLMNKEFYILGNMLTFKTCINTKYSYFNSLFNIGIGVLPHIVLIIVFILFSLVVFDFIKERYIDNNLVHILFDFLFAGEFCSLIDKVAWGGSLDYIKLKGFFTFDLKDVYITIFEIMLIYAMVFNWKKLKGIDNKAIYNEFKTYIKTK